jgi:trk system potassium uptake protein TrkH
MAAFEAAIHAFGSAGTGGFSVRPDSLTSYSPFLQWAVAVFMFLFGVNFNLYFLVLLGKAKEALKSEELRWFFCISLVSIALITLNILPLYHSFGESLRLSAFQVGTIISTTGYATADFNQWPEFSKWILVMLMLSGSCAGSTCGGMKISRIVLLFKGVRQELWRQQHPHGVSVVRLEGKPVAETTLHTTLVFAACYIGILFFGTLLLSLDGFDFTTNFTGTLACISNIGPGLNVVGPAGNYALFSPLNKLLLTFIMLLGRLEIFPLLLLFSPSVWRKR